MNWLIELLTPHHRMLGSDFSIIWQIGRAVITGGNPYGVAESFYPPAGSLLFAIFGALPVYVAFPAVLLADAIVLVAMTKRRALIWLLFVPTFFMFAFGQIDLFLIALIPWLASQPKWKSALAFAVLTIKPQLAIVILPWYAVRWLRSDRSRLAWAAGAAFILNALPLAYDPAIYSRWLATTAQGAGHKFGGQSIWQLREILPMPVIAIGAAALVAVALVSDERISRVLMILANPVFAYYDLVILIEVAPAWLMTPISLFALAGYLTFAHASVYMIVPLSAIVYLVGSAVARRMPMIVNGRGFKFQMFKDWEAIRTDRGAWSASQSKSSLLPTLWEVE